MQLSAMELRCRSVVSEKNDLEEKLGDMEREKKTSEKKIQQVSRTGGDIVQVAILFPLASTESGQANLAAQRRERGTTAQCECGEHGVCVRCGFISQLNKCLSENQKLWKDRVTVLEEKFDVTMKQKEKVCLI